MCCLQSAKHACQFLQALKEYGDELKALKLLSCLELFFDTKKWLMKKSKEYRDRKERAGEEVRAYIKKEKKEKKGQDKDDGVKKGEDVESCAKRRSDMMENTWQPGRYLCPRNSTPHAGELLEKEIKGIAGSKRGIEKGWEGIQGAWEVDG